MSLCLLERFSPLDNFFLFSRGASHGYQIAQVHGPFLTNLYQYLTFDREEKFWSRQKSGHVGYTFLSELSSRQCFKDQFTLRDPHLVHRDSEHQVREWVQSLKKVTRQCAAAVSGVTRGCSVGCNQMCLTSWTRHRATSAQELQDRKNICINNYTLEPSLYFSNYQLQFGNNPLTVLHWQTFSVRT